MKIAIAAEGQDFNAQVSYHGARAPYYLIIDEKGNLLKAVRNPYSKGEQGAGPKAAHLLIQHGVELVVAADFGGRFIGELEAAGVQLVQKTGMVADIITNVLAK